MNEYDKVVSSLNIDDEKPVNPYDTAVDEVLGLNKSAASVSAFVASKKKPEQYAEAVKLSRDSGLPVDMVERNLPAVKEAAAKKAVDYDAIVRDFPKTSLILQDPITAPMVVDDLDNLTGLERVFRDDTAYLRTSTDLVRSVPAGAMKGLGTGLQGLDRLYGVYERSVNRALKFALPDELVDTLNNPPGWSYIAPLIDVPNAVGATGKLVEKGGEVTGAPEERQNLGTQTLEGIGQIATYIITGPVGPAIMAGQGAEQQGRRVDAAGAGGTAEGDTAILLGAAATAVTEKVQLGVLLKRTPIFGNLISKLPVEFQNKWLNRVVDVGGAAVSEATQETVEGFLHDFIEYSLYNPDVEFLKGWEQDALAAGGAGGAFRGFFLALTKGRAKAQADIQKQEPQARAEAEQNVISTLDALAQESKLAARDPETFQQHVARVAEGTGVENVYVSGEALSELFQSGAVDATKLNAIAPEVQQQLAEAMATGGDVIIPVEKAMRLMASGEFTELYQDMRLRVDSLSARDASKADEQQDEKIEDEPEGDDAAAEAGQQIYEDILQQQLEAGVPEREARQNAELTKQRYLARGERLGTSALDLYQSEGLEIQRAQGDAKSPSEGELMQGAPETPEFKAWFGESKVVDEDGAPLTLFHGTTHDVEQFTTERANVENDFGKGFYFTNSNEDVAENYAGEGPDLTQRVQLLAERIASDTDREYDDPDVVAEARKQLVGGGSNTMPVYVSLKNPVVLGGENETFFDYELNDLDENGEPLDYEVEPEGKLIELVDALRSVAADFTDADADAAAGALMEKALDNGGLTATEVEQVLRSEEAGLLYAADFDTGDLAIGELIRRTFEYAGYDGIIDNNVNEKFGDARKIGKSMAGVTEGTAHYIAFKPEQIKSVFNRGTFDPNDPRILNQPDGSGMNPRGSIRAGEGKSIITLFEKSDASTLVHELGHQWMFELARDAKREGAPEQLTKDLDTLLKFTEQTDIDAFTKSVEAQEKLARAFEAYLMEGKAPSVELRGAFQRFAAWLTRIYKSMKALNVAINDDVRAVFDRLLATDEQIEAAREVERLKADPNLLDLLTEAEKKDYLKRTERAKEAAETKLRTKLMKEIARERAEWWKEESEKVADEVETRLRQRPAYKLLDYMKDGVVLDANGEEIGVGEKPTRISKAALVEQFGKQRVEALRKKFGQPLYAKDGAHPDEVAETFGFSSAAEMVDVLENTERLKDAVKAETDAIMKERHGDILNDGSIQEEAIAATKNDEQADMLSQELAILARKVGNRRLLIAREALKQTAEDMVARKRVGDVKRYMRYYYAGIKASKEAGKALAKKDYRKAAEAKRKQLLNHFLYIAHRDAAVEMDKAQRYLRRFDKEKVRGQIRTEYMTQIDALLDGVDFRKSAPSPASQIGRTERLLKARAGADALKAFIAAKEAEGDAMAVDVRLTLPEGWKSYKDMSIDELRGLRDSVENLEHLARVKNQLILNGRKRELNEVADEVVNTIHDNLKGKKQVINTRRASAKRGRFIESSFGLITKAQTFIESMDGGKKIGTVYDAIKRDVDEGTNARVKREQEAAKTYYDLLAKHYAKGKVGDIVLTLTNLKKQDIWVEEIGDTVSREEVIAVALNWGNADNRQKLMEGRNWNEGQVEAILQNMEQRDWEFVQDAWKWIDSFWPEISARENRRTGVIPEKVQGMDVQTNFGVIKGNYYPLKYDGNLDYDTRAQEMEANFKEMRAGKFVRAQTRRGHTKARVEGVRKPVRLDLGVVTEHVNQVIADITVGEAIENTHRILHHKEVKKAISETLGVETYNQLDMWLKDVAASGLSASDGFSAIARNLRVSVSVGAMGLKLGTTLLQASGFSHSLVELRPKWMLKGVVKFITGTPWKTAGEVYEMSSFMRERSTTFQRDLLDAVRALEGKGAISNVQKLYFWPIVKMQQVVDIPTFIGAYEKALAEGRTDADAIRYAEQAVENAQGSGLVTALSPFERGTVSENTRMSEAVRLWGTFYSYFNTKLNIAMRQTKQTNFRDPVSVAKLASDYLMLFWVEALITELIAGRMPDFEDEDDNALWWNVKLAVTNMLGTIPFLREMASAMKGFGSGPAGARGLDDITKGMKRAYKAVENAVEGEAIDFYALVKGVLNAGNVVSPVKLPTGQIGVALDAMKRADEGEDVAPIDYILRPKKE